MILHLPDDYEQFHCIGGACPENCCIGWELEIDEETATYYRTVDGPLGDRLRQAVDDAEKRKTPDGMVYALKMDGRCRFLDPDNHCEIVRALSEDALCDVCAEYPRYTVVTGPYIEKSLTLSCPEAARLFVERTEPLMFVEYDVADTPKEAADAGMETDLQTEDSAADPGRTDPEIPDGEDRIFAIRMEAMNLLYGEETLNRFFPDQSFSKEPFPIRLRQYLREYACIEPTRDPIGDFPQLAAENLLLYCTFRYFPRAADADEIPGWARFAYLALLTVRDRWQEWGADGDALRRALSFWSKNIEHSEENIEQIYRSVTADEAWSGH